jgi:hypothetical protein
MTNGAQRQHPATARRAGPARTPPRVAPGSEEPYHPAKAAHGPGQGVGENYSDNGQTVLELPNRFGAAAGSLLAATLSVHDLAAFVVHVLAGFGGDEDARPGA